CPRRSAIGGVESSSFLLFCLILALLAKDVFGLLELRPPRGFKVLAGAIDEVLDHADRRAGPSGAHILSSHRSSDGCRVFGEYPLWGMSRIRLDLTHPAIWLQVVRGHVLRPVSTWESVSLTAATICARREREGVRLSFQPVLGLQYRLRDLFRQIPFI